MRALLLIPLGWWFLEPSTMTTTTNLGFVHAFVPLQQQQQQTLQRHQQRFHHEHHHPTIRKQTLLYGLFRNSLTEERVVASAASTAWRDESPFPVPTPPTMEEARLIPRLVSTSSSREAEPQQLNNRHSASDWLYNIRSIPYSGVLREVRNPVLAVAGWSLAVSVVHRLVQLFGKSSWAAMMCIPPTAHSFLVSALGLLLVFRTNSAYQRFYEGSKIWENILSISRNMSRMVQLYSREVGSDRKARLLNLVAAYPYLLRHHIRPGCLCQDESQGQTVEAKHRLLLHDPSLMTVETRHDCDKTCGGTTRPELLSKAKPRECWVDRRELPWSLFQPRALPQLAMAQNRPLWVCDRIGREIMTIPYGPNFTSRERLSLLGQVEKLTNAVGQCERIHQTAVPLNYARHSLRSLTIWLFTLPFALVKDLGLLTAPATAVIAWLLLGVYQIGYSIEDPFQGSLRLSILCDAIRRDIIGDSGKVRDTAYQLDEDWGHDGEFNNIPASATATSTTANGLDGTTAFTNPNHHRVAATTTNSIDALVDEKLLKAPQFIERNGTWQVVAAGKQ